MIWGFSNRHRLQKIAVAILLIFTLCIHTQIAGNQYTKEKLVFLNNCLRNPDSCVGIPLVMRVRVYQSENHSIIVHPRIEGKYQIRFPILLTGSLDEFQSGDIIDVLISYASDGTFLLIRYHKDNWIRPVKYGVSLLGLLLALLLLRRRYRFSPDRFFPLIYR